MVGYPACDETNDIPDPLNLGALIFKSVVGAVSLKNGGIFEEGSTAPYLKNEHLGFATTS